MRPTARVATALLGVGAIVAASVGLRSILAEDNAPAGSTPPAPISSAPVRAEPFPGVPRGEVALYTVHVSETIRRCQIRWNVTKGRAMPPIQRIVGRDPDGRLNHPGDLVTTESAPGSWFNCVIPGDLLPSRADRAETDAAHIAQDPQGLLRRCSSELWHDLSDWKIVARSIQPGVLAAIVAVSPSGRFAAHCYLGGKAIRTDAGGRSSVFWSRITEARTIPNSLNDWRTQPIHGYFQHVYDTCAKPGLRCVGQLFVESGRVPLHVTRIRVESVRGGPPRPVNSAVAGPVTGPVTTVAVRQGWFAVAWADGLKADCARARVTAYDARGRVVGAVSYPNGEGKCR